MIAGLLKLKYYIIKEGIVIKYASGIHGQAFKLSDLVFIIKKSL